MILEFLDFLNILVTSKNKIENFNFRFRFRFQGKLKRICIAIMAMICMVELFPNI